MPFRLAGLGVASPPHRLPVAAAIEMAQRLCAESPKHARLIEALYRHSGVAERQSCVPYETAFQWEGTPDGPSLAERMTLYEEHAAPLAIAAVRGALEQADIAPRRVTHLVTVSCTGFEAPGVDHALIDQLGLSPDTQRVNVGFMGCHGAINGLRVVHGLAAADPDAVVLMVCTELCSLHYFYGWDPERLVGNALFGDGAAAVVGTSQAEPTRGTLLATGSRLLPASRDLMSWRVRDHGFEMTLSAKLPGLIAEHLHEWLVGWLDKHSIGLADVGAWAIHPGGPKVLTAVEKALELPDTATQVSRDVLHDHGNMSSATVLFLLDRLRQSAAAGPTVMLGFGPGIEAEVALWS